jgi:hypothetical protein
MITIAVVVKYSEEFPASAKHTMCVSARAFGKMDVEERAEPKPCAYSCPIFGLRNWRCCEEE